MHLQLAASLACLLTAGSLAAAQTDTPVTQPLEKDGQLVFPPDAEIPRNLTDVERRYLDANPLAAARGITPAPTGPFR